MLYKNTIESIESYLEEYPETEVKELLETVKSNEQIIKRENISGHITASGLVLHDDRLLLIFHKKLERYLQPGGHLEDDETLLEAAQREVLEETGLQTEPYKLNDGEVTRPFHIDIHKIPHNEKKNEPEHFHYDCMFLLTTNSSEVSLEETEVGDYKWVSLDHPFSDKGIILAAEKIKKLIS